MSKIWDALKKAELEREPVDGGSDDAAVPRILTARQRAALDALLRSATVADAAAASGITQRSLERWLKTPAFAAAYHAAGRAAFGEAVLELKAASREATAVLRTAMHDADPVLRVRAAEAIVTAASRLELAAAIVQANRASKRRA